MCLCMYVCVSPKQSVVLQNGLLLLSHVDSVVYYGRVILQHIDICCRACRARASLHCVTFRPVICVEIIASVIGCSTLFAVLGTSHSLVSNHFLSHTIKLQNLPSATVWCQGLSISVHLWMVYSSFGFASHVVTFETFNLNVGTFKSVQFD